MTPEGKVKADLKKYLSSLGEACWYYCPVPMGYGKRGVPDFIICYKGYFIAPETKRPGGKSEPFQNEQHEQIRAAGGFAGRVTDVEQVMVWVRSIDALEN